MITTNSSENKVVCVSLPANVADALDEAAKLEHRSRSNMAAFIITHHLNGESA